MFVFSEMAEAKKSTEGPAIGIDLGTTFSCVAVVRNGKVEVIANELGHFTTPSYVAFNENERLIGDAAKRQLSSNSANTLFDAKRLIGRKFNDPIVQKDMQQWPFAVVDVNGMPKVQITYKNEMKQFTAEEISAMVLEKMKLIAESYLNATVKNAVVTVPAHFNDLQRKATKDAGAIAGLNILRIINEPTAAAIAYGMNNDTTVAKNVLIYDLGGGTFDVSILNICGDVYEVKATAGDQHLGGEDFDQILMETFATEFKHKHNVDMSVNKRALRRLRIACEQAKRELSTATQTSIEIDSLCDGIDFVTTLTRARFDELCAGLFQITIKVVKSAVKDAGLGCECIDTVVLAGGSTRIIKIQQFLRDLFEGKEMSKTINPDETVAYGAAVQAAKMHGGSSTEVKNMKLIDVTPLTLGVSVCEDAHDCLEYRMSLIIKRNTPIPVSMSKDFCVTESLTGVQEFRTGILQGEHLLSKDNFRIGDLHIQGIPPAPANVPVVTVTFTIDANGILTVYADCKFNRNARNSITIANVCGSLTKEEIEQMICEASMCRNRESEEYQAARDDLEQYCNKIKKKIGGKRNFAYEKCEEVLSWLDSCVRPTISQFVEIKNELSAHISSAEAKKAKNENDVMMTTSKSFCQMIPFTKLTTK